MPSAPGRSTARAHPWSPTRSPRARSGRAPAWQQIVAGAKAGRGVIHFIGLFSDGNVHSHIDHLRAMVLRAKEEGVPAVRIHILLDGRDVPETSALDYVLPFEAFLAEVSSGGFRRPHRLGRWPDEHHHGSLRGELEHGRKGWHTHVLGEGDQYASASAAIKALRVKFPGTIDQDLPPFVIASDGRPVGTIEDGDSVVFFNFRGDRSIEITRAFEEAAFDKFDRVRVPRVTYAGMLQYDGDLKLPSASWSIRRPFSTPWASGLPNPALPSLPARKRRSSAT
jgi:2,3-bisphosphoglycerate-independent phosphoglycerate mutase